MMNWNAKQFHPHRPQAPAGNTNHTPANGAIPRAGPPPRPRGSPPSAEDINKVRRIRELFKGRFSEDVIADLLTYSDGDERVTTGHLLNYPDHNDDDPRLQEILIRLGMERLGDNSVAILRQAKKGTIETDTRLFGCEDCDNDWWQKVPARKPVSKCRLCKVKYDPIPRDFEWGWAIFDCQCGNQFSGYGQMNKTESRCYKCQSICRPTEIRRPDKRGPSKSRNRHQCNAPDCAGHGHGDGRQRGGSPGRGQPGGGPGSGPPRGGPPRGGPSGGGGRGGAGGPPRGGRGPWNQQCVHPNTRRKKVLMGSRRHQSTGSTVDTFLSQTDLKPTKEKVFTPPFDTISEVGEDDISPNVSDNE